MHLAEYAQYDGLALAGLVKSRQLTPGEVAILAVEAVEKVNPQINAVIQTYNERVEALGDRPAPAGPFSGVPFLLKDLGAAEAGQTQEKGSRLLRGHRVAQDDTYLVQRFKAAGLTLQGRTATPEFGLSSSTESVLMGATRNPWNLDLMAGGSSGGSAASVAAGIVPVAHASDGAGSIRIPASACGLVGLKPSRGRVSRGPHAAESLWGMGVEFVVSRSVRDTAAMLDAVSKPGVGDPFTIVQPERPFMQEVGAPTGRLRIAFTTAPWGPFPIDPQIAEATRQVAVRCDAMGHVVEESSLSYEYDQFLRAICVFWGFGFDVAIDESATYVGRTVDEGTLEPVTLSLYHYAKTLTPTDWTWAENVLNQVRRSTGRFFENYDLLLTPTLIQLPEPIGKYSQNATDVDFFGFFQRCDETGVFLPLFNVTGQPAISLPLAQSQSGLPVGMQLVARFGDEAALIRLAAAFEQAVPWEGRIPPVHASR
jgi:amidase